MSYSRAEVNASNNAFSHSFEITTVNQTKEVELSGERIILLLLSCVLVMALMNTSMFNLALPGITKDFNLSSVASSWIVTGYSIVFAIASITYSRLSDFVPIRRLLVIALVLIGTSSIVGLVSNSFVILLAARLGQASGAGAVITLTTVLFTRYVPISRRGKIMAVIMSAVSLGLGLGPIIGGGIVQFLGWHYLFIITIPVLLFIPLFLKYLPNENPTKGKFDLLGAVLLGASTTGVLISLTSFSWISLSVGLLGIILFVFRIKKTREPFVQPILFGNRKYLLLAFAGIAIYMCSFASLFLLPQIFIRHFESTASFAGLILFPGSLLAILVSRIVGNLIDRHGNRLILHFAPIIVLIATVLFALFATKASISILFIYIIMSFGFTIMSSSVSNELSRILDKELVGSGMGLFQLLQFFSGALTVAVIASAMEWQSKLQLSVAFNNIFWGLAVVALLGITFALLYRRIKTL